MQMVLKFTVFGMALLFSPHAVPGITGSSIAPDQAKLSLDFQNAKRQDVGVAPMEWSPELASSAQQWADHLATDRGCALEHTTNNKFGENLFGGRGAEFTPLDAARKWYGEIEKFKYGVLTDSNWDAAGHYTQMIWSKTTKVGMGRATCSGGRVVIVAEYDPAGNYMGEKPY